MAMFGRTKPQSALTGTMGILPGDQGPFGLPQTPPVQMDTPQKDPRWLEGGKFTWKDGLGLALGAVGDALSGQPITAARVDNSFQRQRDLKQQAQQRNMQLSDWLWKQQWERNNPKPVNNDTVADYEFIRSRLGDKAAEEYLQNKANPPQYRPGPDGMFYRIETAKNPAAPPPATLPPDFNFDGDGSGNAAGGF